MKIAFLSSMYGSTWGGSEELWGGAALHLRKLGHEVFAGWIDWPGPAPKRDSLREAGCRSGGAPSSVNKMAACLADIAGASASPVCSSNLDLLVVDEATFDLDTAAEYS